MIVYCADVGSVKAEPSRFGWARAVKHGGAPSVKGGTQIDILLKLLEDDIRKGEAVTLGIESPLFLPVPSTSAGLSAGRKREGDRSCFAPAGGYVALLGLHELAFLLSQLRARAATLAVTLDWESWRPVSGAPLLLWEAFVSGSAHTKIGEQSGMLRPLRRAFLTTSVSRWRAP